MKNSTWKNIKSQLILIGCLTLSLTSCGATADSSVGRMASTDTNLKSSAFSDAMQYAGESSSEYGYTDSNAEEMADNIIVHAEETSDYGVQNVDIQLNQEKLVYTCSMSVDVLDFDGSVSALEEKIKQYGGFVESESISDNRRKDLYLDLETPVWHTLESTIRIPSKSYELFCKEVADLGYLRNKDAMVDNLSQEYSDLTTDLKIYEAKEARYLERLSSAKDDATAIAIENTLTSLQIEIARIKSRMNQIQTDVAYSYVYLTVNEVKEFITEEPAEEPEFIERLTEVLKDSGHTFLNFLEALLYILIYTLPYLILLAGFILVVVAVFRFMKAHKLRSICKAYKGSTTKSTEDSKVNSVFSEVSNGVDVAETGDSSIDKSEDFDSDSSEMIDDTQTDIDDCDATDSVDPSTVFHS